MRSGIATVVDSRFQSYLPLWVWCINHSYPEYQVLTFLTGPAEPFLQPALDQAGARVKLFPNEFGPGEYQHRPRRFGALCRFLLLSDERRARCFPDLEELYITDSDLMIVRQDPDLMTAHRLHCEVTGLPYSNLLRDPGRFEDKHMTGLHYASAKFLDAVGDTASQYDRWFRAVGGGVLDGKAVIWDERLLYQLVRDAGIELPAYLYDEDLEAENHANYRRVAYRPWHGLNIGRAFAPGFPANFARAELPWFRDTVAAFSDMTREPGFIAAANWLTPKQAYGLALMLAAGGAIPRSPWGLARVHRGGSDALR